MGLEQTRSGNRVRPLDTRVNPSHKLLGISLKILYTSFRYQGPPTTVPKKKEKVEDAIMWR